MATTTSNAAPTDHNPRLKRTTLGHIREPKRYCAKMEAITVKVFIANEVATAIGISSLAANLEP